jgi:hypothetical protein
MTPNRCRQACAPLPTRSRRSRSSSEKLVVVQVHPWTCVVRAAVST